MPVRLWEVCIPTLHADEGRTVEGCQIWVVRASGPADARRMVLARAMEPRALRHRRDAALDVCRLLVYAWPEGR